MHGPISTQTANIHLPVIGEVGPAVVSVAVIVFAIGMLVGMVLRSWWALLYSPVLTGIWNVAAIIFDHPSDPNGTYLIEIVVIQGVIPGTTGVLIGIAVGFLIHRLLIRT